jgi:glucose/arabinose dehydrogenase
VASGLDAPVGVATRSGDPTAIYVVEQAGRIRVVRDGDLYDVPVLDIRDRVTAGGEQGLLGLAFHPDPSDRRLFVYYTNLGGDQVVASFEMDPATPDRALPDSERVLLTMPDRFANHNGGAVVFGPDGYLYISTGDGGGGGDPLGSGERLDTLLAKILRIDVDRSGTDGTAYAIPPDNPFADEPNARPEIWHTGLRNPWRMKFDSVTGDLWIGDVGQSAWEEIDRGPAGIGGLDFGWSRMEGFECYPPSQNDCETPDLTTPVAAYGHDLGCAVVGGTVYRGSTQPGLAGWYVFADYCSGRVWVLDPTAPPPVEPQLALDSSRNISAIGQDAAGELFATDIASGELLHVEVAGD